MRLGLGFTYDLVCDAVLTSIWLGMKNEFFFTIPRRKVLHCCCTGHYSTLAVFQVTVSYSVPGVSDSGPNPPNRIL